MMDVPVRHHPILLDRYNRDGRITGLLMVVWLNRRGVGRGRVHFV
jgi:hypothetical protein